MLPIFGQYIHEGECRKDVEVVQDFNLEKVSFYYEKWNYNYYITYDLHPQYMVKWYEIQRYEVYFQRDSECSVSRFDKETDGSIIVQNSWLMKNNPRRTQIEGSVTLADPSLDPKAGKLIVSFNKQKPGTTANYLILDTDYQNYSIAWHCYSVGNGKVAGKW